MMYRHIHGTDLRPSSICLGTGQMGSGINNENSIELLDSFLQMGGNFLDTAHVYGDWVPGEKSLSEKTVGAWVKEKGIRNDIIIATKGGMPTFESYEKYQNGEGPFLPRLSSKEITQDLQESLEFLQVDYIDLYWLHRDDPSIPVQEILETLNIQVDKGTIRYFGCSNWKVDRIEEAENYASVQGLECFVANQMLWSLAIPNIDFMEKSLVTIDARTINFHKKTQMAAIPFSSQAKGFFTKLSKGNNADLDDSLKRVYLNKENKKRMERLRQVAKKLERSITEVVLSYLISQPFTTIPIVGCRTVDQLHESLEAGDLILDPSTVRYLETGN